MSVHRWFAPVTPEGFQSLKASATQRDAISLVD